MYKVEQFLGQTDTGKQYVIIKTQEYFDADDVDGSGDVESITSYSTPDGLRINMIDPETFQIIKTHEIVRKV